MRVDERKVIYLRRGALNGSLIDIPLFLLRGAERRDFLLDSMLDVTTLFPLVLAIPARHNHTNIDPVNVS